MCAAAGTSEPAVRHRPGARGDSIGDVSNDSMFLDLVGQLKVRNVIAQT
jgi:hypothetical protein